MKPIPKELLDTVTYKDGQLFRRDKPATAVSSQGYIRFKWRGTRYLAHRVVWAMHHGDTDQIIDHINCDKTDNRIENLRLSNHRANAINTGRNEGVVWDTAQSRWLARINSRYLYGGLDLMEAWCRRKSEELRLITEATER
jgi:hypothetical protein